MEPNAGLAELLDKQEIHETLLRYFRGVDRCDATLITSAFHPDAVAEHGPRHERGIDIGDKMVPRLRERWRATMHFAANQIIEIETDVARVETYALNHHLFNRDDQEHLFVRAIRYIDRLERRDGVWKIAHRRVICEWDRIEPISERSTFPPYILPLRSRDDLCYQPAPPAT